LQKQARPQNYREKKPDFRREDWGGKRGLRRRLGATLKTPVEGSAKNRGPKKSNTKRTRKGGKRSLGRDHQKSKKHKRRCSSK